MYIFAVLMKRIQSLYKSFKNSFIFKMLGNFYVLSFCIFIIWMLFFDESSYLIHRDLNKQIKEADQSIQFYKKEIEKNKKELQTFKNPKALEKFARENYFMKKENEDIFIFDED